jgi:drug/metabolite transporter (DMT)-like permease
MIRFSRILGILFLLLGFILASYGYFTQGDPMYSVSLGKNINLIWGFVLMGAGFLFGISSLIPEKD